MRLTTSLALLLSCSVASAVPLEFTHQGRLMDTSGVPITGDHSIEFRIYDDPATGTLLWSETHATTSFDGGYYAAELGTITTLDAATFDADDLWLTMSIDAGPELPGRIKLVSVPFAIRALNVGGGGIVDASEIQIDGTTVIDSSGAVSASWNDLTDIPAEFADGADGDTLASLASSCTAGQITSWDGTAWGCIDNTHDASAIVSGTLAIERLPVGDDDQSVAAGDHLHPFTEVTGIASDAQIPDLDAARITSGTLAFGRLPVGTTAGTVAEGNHSHSDGDLPSGDVLGTRPVIDMIVTRDSWTDGTVTWTDANETYSAEPGWMDVGGSFASSGPMYLRFPIVGAGVLDDAHTYEVEVEWVRDCRSGDCDTVTRILDGSGNEVRIGTYDNEGGRVNPADSDGFNEDWELGSQGTPQHVKAIWTIGGGNPSQLDWQTWDLDGLSFADREQLNTVIEPAAGLTYRVSGGDPGEAYRERFVRVRITRIR